MKLQHLKNLAEKEIIRMRDLYERANFTSNQMNSRLHRMTGQLTQEEAKALENSAIEIVGDLVNTLDLPRDKIAHFLNIEINYQRNPWFPEVRVMPLATIDQSDIKMEVFLEQDKFSARANMLSKAEIDFKKPVEAYKFINIRKPTITNRGRSFMKAFSEELENGYEMEEFSE